MMLLQRLLGFDPAPKPRDEVDGVPMCDDHHVPMRLRGKLGRPTRFEDQTQEEYTLVYFCPVEGCNETAEVPQVRSQIPVAGAAPERPPFSRLFER